MKKIIKIFFILIICLFYTNTYSATINSPTCSQVDVQNAVNSANDGDTVQVPAGVCTWTESLNIGSYSYATKKSTSKSIILQGAGIDKTIITDKVNNALSGIYNKNGINVNIQAGKLVRITGFTFDGSQTPDNFSSITISGDVQSSPAFRVDHSKFDNVSERGVNAQFVYGLIDHNIFIRKPDAPSPTLVSITGDITLRTGDPNDSWARPQDMGTNKAVYMEDNIFIHNINANGPFDAYERARYVFRYNNVYGNNLGHHGFDSSYRGIVNFEIYNNIFTNASPTGEIYKHGIVFEFRSGSGVLFNNVVNRSPISNATNGFYDKFVLLRNYRSDPAYTVNVGGGPCDGTNINDGNQLDKDTNGDGVFDASSGYPCKDQIGRSSNQILSPVYAWNNNFQGNLGGNLTVGEHGANTITSTYHIIENRDYYNGVAKPGYTPYVYPHPMINSGFTSDSNTPPPPTPSYPTYSTPPTYPTYNTYPSYPTYTTTVDGKPLSYIPQRVKDYVDQNPGSSCYNTTFNSNETTECFRYSLNKDSFSWTTTPPTTTNTTTTNNNNTQTTTTTTQTTPTTTTNKLKGPNLTRTLTVGNRGEDVLKLQDYLIKLNYLKSIYKTGYFGYLTRDAVRRFQCDRLSICSGNESTTGFGLVGKRTRGEVGR